MCRQRLRQVHDPANGASWNGHVPASLFMVAVDIGDVRDEDLAVLTVVSQPPY
jgi:hypothetical protein